jgi:hypothetical protein
MGRQVADGGTRVRLTRALVLLVVASGLAFAASRFSPPPMRLRQADPAPAEAPGPPPAAAEEGTDDAAAAGAGEAPADEGAVPAGEDAADVAPVRELTAEEIEAELEAAEAAMGGAAPADARNRAAERPLPADLPVALPSDI